MALVGFLFHLEWLTLCDRAREVRSRKIYWTMRGTRERERERERERDIVISVYREALES